MMMSGEETALDVQLGRLIGRLAMAHGSVLETVARQLSRSTREGRNCVPLTALADPAELREMLAESRLCSAGEAAAPFVLDRRGRLYLHRYWHYEQSLARQIVSRLEPVVLDEKQLAKDLEELFPVAAGNADQRAAALCAATRRFCVIAGGPGTGKTTTVVRVLALLMRQRGTAPLRVGLVAPTGKAAARLGEAFERGRDEVGADLVVEPATIHRFLGLRENAGTDHAPRMRPVDLLVVDEASMISLPLMAKLLEAVPTEARIVLLGDPDQLGPVDGGAVLADVLAGCEESGQARLAGCVVRLRQNFRFPAASGIGRACESVREGEVPSEEAGGNFSWKSLPPLSELKRELRAVLLPAYRHYLQADHPEEALERFSKMRVLCALRVGPWGAVAINRVIEEILREAGLIEGGRYHGMPLLITVNDYQLRLFNGDLGMVWREPGGALFAWFRDESGCRKIAPLRLPSHETAFAMTVHKSQGSEFEKILLILPTGQEELVTRELVYTGITRAVKQVEVWACDLSLAERASGGSGLAETLQDLTATPALSADKSGVPDGPLPARGRAKRARGRRS